MKELISILLGATRSNRKVFYQLSLTTSSVQSSYFVSPADHLDAYCIYEFLCVRELRQNGETILLKSYLDLCQEHINAIGSLVEFNAFKLSEGLATSIDVSKRGRLLVLECFKDLV